MKITLIHGQNHKGSTYHIARMTAEKISSEIDEFFLPDDFDGRCIGCLACLHKGREFCPNADKVKGIFSSMLSSDVIIIGSPTYCLEMTAHLKALFEHLFTVFMPHRPEEAMFSKTAVVISTAAGAGMNGVVKSISRQLFYLGIPKIYNLPYRVMASSWDGVEYTLKRKIAADTDKIAHKISMREKPVTPGIKTKFMFSIMRTEQKSNEYAPLDKTYWKDKGWLGKKRPWKI